MSSQEAPKERKLDDWIASYMEYTDNTEPPEIYRLWVAISTVAAVLQRTVWIPWGKEITWHPNLYIALVGPSGKARKSTAMRTGRSLLHDTEGVTLANDSTTREALIEQLERSFAEDIDDHGNVVPHHSLTVFSTELTVFLGYDNLQLMTDLTDWFDSPDKWVRSTKTQGDNDLEGVWVNMIGATTPRNIKESLPDGAIGGGFTSRVIFVYASKKGKRVRRPWNHDHQDDLREMLVNDLNLMRNLMGQVKLTQSVKDYWAEEFYDRVSDNPPVDHHRFAGYNQRRPSHTVKLATILSASRRNNLVITMEDFRDADKLLERTEEQMDRTFQGMGKSKSAGTVKDMMDFIAIEEKTNVAELMRRFGQDVEDYDHMMSLLNKLSAQRFLRTKSVDKSNGTTITQAIVNKDSEAYKKLRGES